MPYSEAVDSRVLLTPPARRRSPSPAAARSGSTASSGWFATGLVAEVCSVYLRRDDQWLELCATEGLNPESVHQSRLRVGQGLVGRIAETAEPINTRDALAHPRLPLPARDRRGDVLRASSACRSSASARCSACSSCRTASRANTPTTRSTRSRSIAMVIAEMAELGAFVGPGAMEIARPHKLPFFVRGLVGQEGVAEGTVRAARAADRGRRTRSATIPSASTPACTPPSRRCAPRSTRCWPPTTSPPAASTATCCRPTGCSPTTRAGSGGWRPRSTAASPPRSPSRRSSPRPAPA